jgi:ribonuclease G
MIKTTSTVCSEIYEEIRKLSGDMKGQSLLIRVNPEVARAFEAEEAGLLKELGGLVQSRVMVQGDPMLHQEQFDVVAL